MYRHQVTGYRYISELRHKPMLRPLWPLLLTALCVRGLVYNGTQVLVAPVNSSNSHAVVQCTGFIDFELTEGTEVEYLDAGVKYVMSSRWVSASICFR
jgi:hypothetical protein